MTRIYWVEPEFPEGLEQPQSPHPFDWTDKRLALDDVRFMLNWGATTVTVRVEERND